MHNAKKIDDNILTPPSDLDLMAIFVYGGLGVVFLALAIFFFVEMFNRIWP